MNKFYKLYLANKHFWFTAFVSAESKEAAAKLVEQDSVTLCSAEEELGDYLSMSDEHYEYADEECSMFKYRAYKITELAYDEGCWLDDDDCVDDEMSDVWAESMKAHPKKVFFLKSGPNG